MLSVKVVILTGTIVFARDWHDFGTMDCGVIRSFGGPTSERSSEVWPLEPCPPPRHLAPLLVSSVQGWLILL